MPVPPSGSPPTPSSKKRLKPQQPEGATAAIESESLDQDPLQDEYATIDIANDIKTLYTSMLSWYDRCVAKRKPGDPWSLPPVYMILFPGLFERSWGYDRLYPQVLEDWCLYHAYLHRFCAHNGDLYLDRDAYRLCLEQENSLKSEWVARRAIVPHDEISVSDDIHRCAVQLLLSDRDGSSVAMMAATCITKETELIVERLRLGPGALDPEEPPDLSTQIRKLALSYMSQVQQSCHDVALLVQKVALLGITKEAHTMVQNLRKGYHDFYEVYLNREIRFFALDVLTEKLDGFVALADEVASYGAHDDFRPDFVAQLEADAEHRCWGNNLVESEEASGIENTEKKQQEVEGTVHHTLPPGAGDDINRRNG